MVAWSIVFTIGAIIQTATERALAQMIVGRFIAGLAVGALSGLCPLYLGETAPKKIRGTMVSGYQLLIISGIVVSYAVSWGSHNAVNSSASWRIPVGLQMLWGIMLITLMVFLPESPRWELQRGNAEKARSTMAAMRGITLVQTPNGLRGDVVMEGELEEMKAFIDAEQATFAGTNFFTGYVKCFAREKQLWRRTLAGMLLQFFQQLNGQNFYYYYGATFFSSAQISLNPYEVQFILGIVSWVATFPALYLIEKFGRRSSLLTGSVICAGSAVIVAFVGKLGLAPTGQSPTNGQQMAGNAFIAFAVIHLVGFSTFWGPVPWVYLSESFPQNVRAKCISLGSGTNWYVYAAARLPSPYRAMLTEICLTTGQVLEFHAGLLFASHRQGSWPLHHAHLLWSALLLLDLRLLLHPRDKGLVSGASRRDVREQGSQQALEVLQASCCHGSGAPCRPCLRLTKEAPHEIARERAIRSMPRHGLLGFCIAFRPSSLWQSHSLGSSLPLFSFPPAACLCVRLA